MKIQEIEVTNIIRQARKAKHAPDWAEAFYRHGWELLGQGREGYVGLNPNTNYVIKVWPQNSNYVEFVKFVHAHANNPHFPRFHRKPRPIPGTNYFYIAMEKLEQIEKGNLLGHYFPEMLWLTISLQKRNEWSEQAGEILSYLNKTWPGIWLPMLVPGNKLYRPDLAREIWQKIGEPSASWKQAVKDLEFWVGVNGFSYDLFDFNFMQRGTTLVVVDPVA